MTRQFSETKREMQLSLLQNGQDSSRAEQERKQTALDRLDRLKERYRLLKPHKDDLKLLSTEFAEEKKLDLPLIDLKVINQEPLERVRTELKEMLNLEAGAPQVFDEKYLHASCLERAEHFVRAAKLFYYKNATEKNAFDEKVDTYWNGFNKSNLSYDDLKKIANDLQELINKENKKVFPNKKPPKLLLLDSLLTMREAKREPIKTAVEIEFGWSRTENKWVQINSPMESKNQDFQTTKKIKVVQISHPLWNLTEEQVNEYRSLLTGKRPVWFLNCPEWYQQYLIYYIDLYKDDPAQLKDLLGHPPANLRMQPGLSNHYQIEIKVLEQNEQGVWNEKISLDCGRSSFPGPDFAFIKNPQARLELLKGNLKQMIHDRLRESVAKMAEQWKLAKGQQVIPVPLLIESLLSPAASAVNFVIPPSEDNTLMLRYLRQAIVELSAEFVNPMNVDGYLCDIKFINPNRPINDWRHGIKSAALSAEATNKEEEHEIILSVIQYLEFVVKTPAFKDFEPRKKDAYRLFLKAIRPLSNFNQFDDFNLEDLKQMTDWQRSTGCTDPELVLLSQAVSEYLKIRKTSLPTKDINQQLHLAALQKIIITLLKGVATGFCKSGADRKGFDLDNLKALLAYSVLNSGGLAFSDDPDKNKELIELFNGIFTKCINDLHNNAVRAAECPGSNARKEEKYNCHPIYIKKQNESKDTKAAIKIRSTLGKLTKPASLTKGGKVKSKEINSVEEKSTMNCIRTSVNSKGAEYRRRHGCFTNTSAFTPWLEPQALETIQKALRENIQLNSLLHDDWLELVGFSNKISPKNFLIWLEMFEEFIEPGRLIAKRFNIEEQYNEHCERLLKMIQVQRKFNRELLLTPDVIKLADSIVNGSANEDFFLEKITFPKPAQLKVRMRLIEQYFQENPRRWQEVLKSSQLSYYKTSGCNCNHCADCFSRVGDWICRVPHRNNSYLLEVHLNELIKGLRSDIEKLVKNDSVQKTNCWNFACFQDKTLAAVEKRLEALKDNDNYLFAYVKDHLLQSMDDRRPLMTEEQLIEKMMNQCLTKVATTLLSGDSINANDDIIINIHEATERKTLGVSALENNGRKVAEFFETFPKPSSFASIRRDYFWPISSALFTLLNLGVWSIVMFGLTEEQEDSLGRFYPWYLRITFPLMILTSAISVGGWMFQFGKRTYQEQLAHGFVTNNMFGDSKSDKFNNPTENDVISESSNNDNLDEGIIEQQM